MKIMKPVFGIAAALSVIGLSLVAEVLAAARAAIPT